MQKGLRGFLYLNFSHYAWVRRFIGGRWVRDKREGYEWVQWNDDEDPKLSDYLDWPLNPNEYICEEYPL